MTTFLYKGYKDDGEPVFGSNSFNTKQELEDFLVSKNINDPIIIESDTKFKKGKFSTVSPKELSIFCKQISVMFFSYITIVDGLLLLAEQTDNQQLKTAFNEINTFLENGYTFAESIAMFEHVFGSYLVKMTMIGEKSGNLDVVYADLSIYFEKEFEIRRRLKGAVIYPASLSAITILIAVYLIESVLPLFQSILDSLGAQMSPITSFIIKTSSFLDKYLILFLLAMIAITIGIIAYFHSEKGHYKFDVFKAKSPHFSFITKRIITARFARSLSMLLKSGLDIHYALDQSAVLVNNQYIKEQIKIANEKIKNGEPLASALAETDVFPSLFIRMLTVGEKTGNIDEMLAKTSEIYEIEAYDTIEKTTKLIEPILITILSVAMGLLLIAIMLPMISIMNSL